MKRKRFLHITLLLCIVLLFPCVFSAAQESGMKDTVTGKFTSFDQIVSWQYPYEDSFFTEDADVYHHAIARLSLGMALASFRCTLHPQEQDDNLIDYLTDLGFSNIETDSYRKEPEADSVAYGIASKTIHAGSADFTLLAVVVCSGNYSREWASNVTVGNQARSAGFADAASTVLQAVKDYLEDHPEKGDRKLWISGYSRGGAVANITAADLTDAGLFSDVYAYTFATPRTTKEPGSYSNIFNIIGMEDLVPKIPLADWGFQRYGNDCYMVSGETDADCEKTLERAGELYTQMIGSVMPVNPEIAFQLRILMDYLLMLMPDAQTYTSELQPHIIDFMKNGLDESNALTILMDALHQYGAKTDTNKKELQEMQDYLSMLLNYYYLRGGIQDAPEYLWDPGFGLANLFMEHLPYKYLARMFASDDPQEVFTDNTAYTRLVIYGNPTINILDGEGIVKTILPDGTELIPGTWSAYALPYADAHQDKVLITLPQNVPWTISLYSDHIADIGYTAMSFSGDTVRTVSKEYYSLLMEPGRLYTIRLGTGNPVIETAESDYTDIPLPMEELYSPTTSMRLENNQIVHLTVPKLLNWCIFIAGAMLLELLAYLILLIIRKRKNRQRNTIAAVIIHFLNAALFALMELALWYFLPVFPIARTAGAFLACLSIWIFAFRGYRKNRQKRKWLPVMAGVMVLWLVLSYLLIGRWGGVKWLIPVILYICLFAWACLFWRNKEETSVPR